MDDETGLAHCSIQCRDRRFPPCETCGVGLRIPIRSFEGHYCSLLCATKSDAKQVLCRECCGVLRTVGHAEAHNGTRKLLFCGLECFSRHNERSGGNLTLLSFYDDSLSRSRSRPVGEQQLANAVQGLRAELAELRECVKQLETKKLKTGDE